LLLLLLHFLPPPPLLLLLELGLLVQRMMCLQQLRCWPMQH
jgi:hypothetical protein